jgi:rhodanese-related sulfurtransferase
MANKAEPTPLPNQWADTVLDTNYDRFLAHLVQTDWSISPAELEAELIRTPFLIDLRLPLEIGREGYIPGAVVLPLRELIEKTAVLPEYTIPVYAYSSEPWQCGLIVGGLGVFGWQIRCLEGGCPAWVAAGGEVLHGPPPYPEIDPLKPAFPCCGLFEPGPEFDATLNPDAPHPALVGAVTRLFQTLPDDSGSLKPAELDARLQADPNLLLVDLRTEEERREGGELSAAQVLHLPLADLVARRGEWPADRSAPLVLISTDGGEASVALGLLWAYGYQEARVLSGGYAAWTARH